MEATGRRLSATSGVWALLGLALGLILGIYGFKTGNPAVSGLARLVQPLGVIWVSALRVAILPLLVLQLLTAMTGNGNGKAVGRAGKRTALFIVVMLLAMSVAGYLVSLPLMGLVPTTPESVEAVRGSVLLPDFVQESSSQASVSLGEWLQNLVPINVFAALAQEQLIQVLLVTLVFGLAVNRLPDKRRKPLADIFRAGADAVMIVVRWILTATPMGVFALVVGLALETGVHLMGILGSWLLLSQSVLVFFVLALYPVASLLGRVPIRLFARAALPPQLVGLSTRSSVASMPAQIESGRKHLLFGPTTCGLVIPLLVSTLRIQNAFGNSLRVLFLAQVFGVSLGLPQLIAFTVTVLLISLTTLGIPNPGGVNTLVVLPAYIAAGIPAEGLILLQPVGDLVDYGDTLANTTGHFAGATILSRDDRGGGVGL